MIGRLLRGTALAMIIGCMLAVSLALVLFVPMAVYQAVR